MAALAVHLCPFSGAQTARRSSAFAAEAHSATELEPSATEGACIESPESVRSAPEPPRGRADGNLTMQRRHSEKKATQHSPRLKVHPGTARERAPEGRRRAPRFGVSTNVQLQVSKSIALFARATEVSSSGIRLNVHAGARPGDRYRVILDPSAPAEEGVDAEVRWVGRRNAEGAHPVGMEWVDLPERSRSSIESFLRSARRVG